MKERPIIFSSEMVRAILEDRKRMTRRIVKPQPPESLHAIFKHFPNQQGCPFGKPGEKLWVREGFAWPGEEFILYRADPEAQNIADQWATDKNYPQVRWQPSIHMRRRHSRITLEITNVRVERLHLITESDAKAEGFPIPEQIDNAGGMSANRHFEYYWKDLHGDGSWQEDPFVWVIEFKRVPQGEIANAQ